MPEFHEFQTVRKTVRNTVSREVYRRTYKKMSDMKLIEDICNSRDWDVDAEEHSFLCLAQEHDWASSNSPYYNVYPIMQELILNTKLDISPAFISLPYNTMLFRFQKGHEPFGIKSTLVNLGTPTSIRLGPKMEESSVLAKYNTCPKIVEQNVTFSGKFLTATPDYLVGGLRGSSSDGRMRPVVIQIPLSANNIDTKESAQTRRGPVFERRDGFGCRLVDPTENLPEWLHWQCYHGDYDEAIPLTSSGSSSFAQLELLEETFKSFDRVQIEGPDGARFSADEHTRAILEFHVKLVALVSLLHNGDADKIVEPILLKKYEKKYEETDDEARKQWFIRKSADLGGGRGFTVGKELQDRSVTQPHIRNAHWAVYWTGVGRKIPKLLKRAVTFIAPKLLTEVPTGFMADEEEQTQIPVEYVYLCRDKTQNLVKIGRTKRKVEDRISASQTWVPGGLELIGYVSTGDSVALETQLHRTYADKRRENEFFALTEDDIKTILSRAPS